MQNVPLSKLLPFMVGGTAVAGLENQLIGRELPEELKKVNYGIGASTGALMTMGPKGVLAGLGSLPIKQSLLFGIGGMDKLRRQQQALTDTNLAAAVARKDTAEIERRNAGSARTMAAAFLIPALVGSGALAYYAMNARKKDKAKGGGGGYKTVAERGDRVRNSRKIRLDIPPSALPNDFFKSLLEGEAHPKSNLQVLEKAASSLQMDGGGLSDIIREYLSPIPREAESVGRRLWNSGPMRVGRTIGTLAGEMTGLPSVYRAAKGLGTGLGHIAGGDMDVGGRHLLGAAGNALVAVPTLRWTGLPIAGRLIGRQRLLRQINPALMTASPRPWMVPSVLQRKFITGQPRLAQSMLNNMMGGRRLTATEIAALRNPATRGATRKTLYNSPTLGGNKEILDVIRKAEHPFKWQPFAPRFGATPKSLAGEALLLGRRGLHIADQAGRQVGTFGRRFPNLSMLAAGTPLSLMGEARDEAKLRAFNERYPAPVLPTWQDQVDPSMFQSLVQAVGNRPQPQVAEQLRGQFADPFGWNAGR